MRDHDEVVKSILRKTEQYEKERYEKKCGRKKILRATAGILAVFAVAFTTFVVMKYQLNEENGINETVPSITSHPTGVIGISENIPSVTSIPVNSEAVRPEHIYIRAEQSEESYDEAGDDMIPGDIKIGSQSLQKVVDDTRDDNLFFEIEIRFCGKGSLADNNWKRLVEKETAHIKEQGVYVEKVNDASVDVVISKEQLVCLETPEDCAYWIIWSE